jgi:hypothetical protein
MSSLGTSGGEAAFSDFVDSLVDVIGHADRAAPWKDYCLWLLLSVHRRVWLPDLPAGGHSPLRTAHCQKPPKTWHSRESSISQTAQSGQNATSNIHSPPSDEN